MHAATQKYFNYANIREVGLYCTLCSNMLFLGNKPPHADISTAPLLTVDMFVGQEMQCLDPVSA